MSGWKLTPDAVKKIVWAFEHIMSEGRSARELCSQLGLDYHASLEIEHIYRKYVKPKGGMSCGG